jgi:hypothetical protein
MGVDELGAWLLTAEHPPRLPEVMLGRSCLLIVRREGVYLGYRFKDGAWDRTPARWMGADRAEVSRTLQTNPPGVPAFIDG